MENNESKTPKKITTDKSSAAKPSATKPSAAKPSATKPSAAKPSASSKVSSKASAGVGSKTNSVAKSIQPKATASKPKTTNASPIKPKANAGTPSPTSSSAKSATTSSSKVAPTTSETPGAKPQVKEIEKSNINKDLIAEDTVDEKKKKKKLLLLLLLLLLGLALLGVGIYFITRIPESEIKFTIEIDATVDATFENENGQIEEYVYIPGDLIKGSLNIRVNNLNINDGNSVFLRFKISVEVDNNYYSGYFYPIFNDREENWYGNGAGQGEVSPDNYYYYTAKCYNDLEILVFENLDFVKDKENNFLNGKTAKLVFTVEILEGNYSAIGQEWPTAPDEWRTTVR